jgi:hypothetical protein
MGSLGLLKSGMVLVWNRNLRRAAGNCCESSTLGREGAKGRYFLYRELSVGGGQGLVGGRAELGS